jgi:hypothetical protein
MGKIIGERDRGKMEERGGGGNESKIIIGERDKKRVGLRKKGIVKNIEKR